MGIFKKAINQDREREIPYLYFMASTGVIGIKSYVRMQSYFGSPEAFYKTDIEKIEKLGIFNQGQIKKIAEAKKYFEPSNAMKILQKRGIELLAYDDEKYPGRLRDIKDPPPVLFLKGRLPEKKSVCASIIGARECSIYGANVARRLGELFSENGISVVSGMARGIDSISQQACIESGGYSLAFLGGGVDVVYPRESGVLYDALAKKGGILSEFPPGTSPLKPYFALRNRLISGMSDVVCVIEAKERSGTMITVDCALEQGREVYALPGRITDITSMGTNELIRQGAGIITDLDGFAQEILDKFSMEEKDNKKSFISECDAIKEVNSNISIVNKLIHSLGLNPNELKVLSRIDDNSFTAEQLAVKVSLPPYEILSLCISLSAKGLLVNVGAGRFKPTLKAIEERNALLEELSGDDDEFGE